MGEIEGRSFDKTVFPENARKYELENC